MLFTDRLEIADAPHVTRAGYMVANCRVARTGCQTYSGSEVGKPDMGDVSVWRPESEVFDAKSLASFAYKPVVIGHPDQSVTADTWKQVAVGLMGGEVLRDGRFVAVPLALMDRKAIDAVRDGTSELSMGYECDLEFADGETPEGEKYQAIQRGIIINHAALVPKGRAGPQCRVGDAWPQLPITDKKELEMPEVALRQVTVDGISIQTTDQGGEAIAKLQKQLADATSTISTKDTALADLRTAHDAFVASLKTEHTKALDASSGQVAALTSAHDGTIDALKADHQKAIDGLNGEVAALKAKMPDAAAMDALIASRAKVIDSARKLLGDKFDATGKTDGEIRRAAVQKRLGDAAVADKSDDYIAAAFDTLTAVGTTDSNTTDPVRDALAGGRSAPADGDAAYDAYKKSLSDGWLNPSVGKGV